MSGAILCKHQDSIVMLSCGEYEQQAKMVDICKRVVKHDEIKLVEVSSTDLDNIMKSQESINKTFEKEFN